MIATVLLAVGLAAGYTFWLRDSSLVEVKHLTVRGLGPAEEQRGQVDEAVRLAMGQMTTLHPRPELLDRELARFPRVAGAEIDTSLPNRATVTLTMRRDGSRMGTGAGEKLIATDGTVLGPAGNRAAGLPRIRSGEPPADGKLKGRDLAQALVLGGAPEKLRPYVLYSEIGDGGVEVTLSNGLVLAFGDAAKTIEKWRAAAAVISDPGLTDADYVDLSVPRRPAVRGPETAEQPVDPIPDPGSETGESG